MHSTGEPGRREMPRALKRAEAGAELGGSEEAAVGGVAGGLGG